MMLAWECLVCWRKKKHGCNGLIIYDACILVMLVWTMDDLISDQNIRCLTKLYVDMPL